MLRSCGKKDDRMEGVFPSNKVPGGMRVGEVAVDPLAAGVLAMGKSSKGPIQSSASSSSSLTTLRICVADGGGLGPPRAGIGSGVGKRWYDVV